MVCALLAFIDGLGAPEMMLIFVVVLVLFGGQKLPEFARGLGKSIREFKKAAAGVEEEFKRALEEDERKNATPKLTAAPPEPLPATDHYTDHSVDPAGPGTEAHPPVTGDDVTTDSVPSSDDGPVSPTADTVPPPEPTILPPTSTPNPPAPTSPKSSVPPPASSYPENPS